MNGPISDKLSIRECLYSKLDYIDQFIQENPAALSAEDLEIAADFRYLKKGRYWVLKYLKQHTIFLDDHYAYGVLALNDPFEKILGYGLPLMVEAVLLPFKGRIIYDGIMQSPGISFGRGISSSIAQEYEQVKAHYGIITSLPVDKATKAAKFRDEDRLALYMKNARSREEYWYEIQELLEKNPALESLYHFLWGKINARSHKKAIKELGVKGYYFAIYNNVVLASGKTKADVEKQLKAMLKKKDLEAVFVFKL